MGAGIYKNTMHYSGDISLKPVTIILLETNLILPNIIKFYMKMESQKITNVSPNQKPKQFYPSRMLTKSEIKSMKLDYEKSSMESREWAKKLYPEYNTKKLLNLKKTS